MHKKTMIYLDPEIHRQLRHRALDEGVSMAEMIRRAAAYYLERQPAPAVDRKSVIRKGVRK